ncbi:MAG: Ig-like domain-containing protein [Geobacteraceae bacterium]|nr:Ig-like domain-containing protein [Geobacteraceae bacterium]
MINLLWSGLLTVLLLSGCGWSGTPTRGPEGIIPLSSIAIVPVSSTIAAGTSTTLTAIGYYAGVPSDITKLVTWSSGNTAAAAFNYTTAPNTNRVTGVAAGSAVITATVGGVSGTYPLTVSTATVTGMTITPANPSLASGLTQQFAVSGTFSNSTTQDLTFDATWGPTPGTYATVSNDPASKGLATALKAGVETITATFGGATPATTQLTVTSPILQSIAVTPANSSVAGFSKTVNFTATGTYSDGTTADVTNTATWASSNTSFATIVSTSGVATTVAAGTTSISATLGSITGKTNLTVTAPVLKTDGLQISPANSTMSLSSGTTQQFTLTATYTDNSTQTVTSISSWSITPASTIATVNTATGLVTATATGIVTIQASYLGQTVSTNLTITP